ncbi:hypothetical protein V1638_04595 [Pseudarthrobacter sp. J64]|uniref:hypothetical protein n=1 Tax=Pseudarthrobacter sp. J64 TaxID=3116485 RepID=UPI002E80EC78|nr:hypothetical protein [Pseudarthrobacter sp. J64]MEE2568672.1 hypothetical protein [Pseudarthrobacter sp. J64]
MTGGLRRPAPEPGRTERLARRRRLLVRSALPVLLALLIAAKLLSVAVFSGQSISAFENRDAAALARAAGALRVANLLETHKPAFAEGDALVLTGDFAGARDRFEESLAAGPGADECRVRVNLVLSIEKLGDAAAEADDPGAAALFGEGLDVVQGAPGGCFAEGAEAVPGFNDAGEGQQLEEAQARLQQKMDDAGTQPGADVQEEPGQEPAEEPEPADAGQQDRLERLKDMAGRALQDRAESEDRQEYLEGTGPPVDRPW